MNRITTNKAKIGVSKRVLLASLLGLSLVASAASLLKTDPAQTTVSATFKQMNVPVESKFKKYTIAIDYDPAKPDASKATVEVETASLDLGDKDYNAEVAKKEWFNSAQFPKATFASTAIKAAGAGKLNVTGKLTIKGKTADVTFPMTVKTEGAKQVFDGALPIKRLAFNIGEGEWKDTTMVADDVTIKFHVTAAH
jgi:polyisoprenoid-binding protein YceI